MRRIKEFIRTENSGKTRTKTVYKRKKREKWEEKREEKKQKDLQAASGTISEKFL